MRDFIFEVNKQNAYTLAEKYILTEYARDYILNNYWPIIKVNNFDAVSIKEKLNTLKNDFIKENSIFDLDIFNRENTEYLIYELNQYIDVLKRGKVKTWNKYNDDFFHIFIIESEIPEKIFLISDKNITQLEIYFKTVFNTIQSFIKQPPQTKNISNELPQIEDVFFVHYQREDFEAGTKIYNLSIYLNGKVIDFSTETETEIIYNFSKKVVELCNSGLIPIHWNQTAPHYGIDHIKSRYKELTGSNLILDYVNDINLAEWLVYNYGENYISHPRLDTLATLNNFNGITDKESKIFHTTRLVLLTKIYFNALKRTLKTELNSNTAPTETETKIPINVIALLHWYNYKSITRDNADTIAKQYNYTAKNSGEGLYQDYLKYSNYADRLASGGTKLKLKNKIQLFENVIKLLTDENAINRAQTDLKTLQSKKKTFD